MPEPPRVTARHLAPCVAVLLTSLLCGGCGTGHAKTRPAAVASPQASHVSVQDLAAALGCTAEITVDAEELREGACGAGAAGYRIATFTADEGQRAWLAESRVYGGTYLVGDRWVVTAASAEALAPLRERLGGKVETGDAHGPGHEDAQPGDAGHDARPGDAGHDARPGDAGHDARPGDAGHGEAGHDAGPGEASGGDAFHAPGHSPSPG
ncbi:hypothetical protein GCM10010347_32890 [Streptomyces cirratus]|uniref:Lipoprotein n=1 Tax=Streptomyces cirratus TaxID=68187 RepID=A0ABQ3F114_9ACTN|nr:hypothetical protein [Streptomyces cirratus]GHB60274.1 hypothetical protein GCM10010347_32890 [Streptomyces cirratus]